MELEIKYSPVTEKIFKDILTELDIKNTVVTKMASIYYDTEERK